MDLALFIQFDNLNDTFIGGLKNSNVSMNRNLIPSNDFDLDGVSFLEGSGAYECNINSNLNFDPAISSDFYKEFLNLIINGRIRNLRVENNLIRITGKFLLASASLNLMDKDLDTLDTELISAGNIEIEKK